MNLFLTAGNEPVLAMTLLSLPLPGRSHSFNTQFFMLQTGIVTDGNEHHLPVLITQLKRSEASLAEVRILSQQTEFILEVLFRIHQVFQQNFIPVSQRGTGNVHR